MKKGVDPSASHQLVVDRPGTPESIVRMQWEHLAEALVHKTFNSCVQKYFGSFPSEAGDTESEWTMF